MSSESNNTSVVSAADGAVALRTGAKLAIVLTALERETFFPDGFGPMVDACEVVSIDNPAELSAEQWAAFLKETQPEILLAGWSMPQTTVEMLADCPSLRHLCYVTGSMRKKIAREFIERGGYATNWGDEAAYAVAECALMLGLMALRKATRFALELHADLDWKPRGEPRCLSLFNRRVGLYGYGAVARKLIPLLRPFNVELEVFSAPVPSEVFAAAGLRQAESLKSLFRDNDVIFVVEALTEDTRHSVNAEVLGELREGSVMVNVGRGAVIDEAAMGEVAKQGKVHFGLDVYEVEPLPVDSPLRGLRNVSLLPHTAGPTIDFYPYCGQRALRNMAAYLRGDVPPDHNDLRRYDLAT